MPIAVRLLQTDHLLVREGTADEVASPQEAE
jgi:hypothetical protein